MTMPCPVKYLLDANVFIQAKNFHYRFDFCQIFWDWLLKAHKADFFFSIHKVKAELEKGNEDDPVQLWMESLPKNFFLPDMQDPAVVSSYREIMAWNATNAHYTEQAKEEFARATVADAFLVAVAKTHGYTLVTHEKSNPATKRRVLLPDAARQFNVKSIMLYDLLSQHAHNNFSLKP